MDRYLYAYRLENEGDEFFFIFPKIPEIISAVKREKFAAMTANDVQAWAADAVLTALQSRITRRAEIPQSDSSNLIKADGFVILSVPQAMKLELFKLYKENCRSILDFSALIGKNETSARRLLDLRHQSRASELENAADLFGKRYVHHWALEPVPKFSTKAMLSLSNPI